jgi:hypothetical protein
LNPRRLAVTVAASVGLLLAGGGVAVVSASASGSVVTASTSVSDHPDTTSASGSGTACTASGGGPVWAKDAYVSQMTAVLTGSNTWRVTLQDNGTFAGFADPKTCDAMTSKGSLLGLYTVTVTSANTPSQATLKSSYSGAVSSTQMVQDFFGDPTAVVSGGDYFFSYEGGDYVQTTSSIYGDVTAYTAPPPVMVKVPNVVGQRAGPALSTLRAAGFAAYTSPARNPARTYVVTGTSPAAGTSAAKGSTVIVYVKQA